MYIYSIRTGFFWQVVAPVSQSSGMYPFIPNSKEDSFIYFDILS